MARLPSDIYSILLVREYLVVFRRLLGASGGSLTRMDTIDGITFQNGSPVNYSSQKFNFGTVTVEEESFIFLFDTDTFKVFEVDQVMLDTLNNYEALSDDLLTQLIVEREPFTTSDYFPTAIFARFHESIEFELPEFSPAELYEMVSCKRIRRNGRCRQTRLKTNGRDRRN